MKRKNTKRTFKSEKEFLEFTLKYQQVIAERDAGSLPYQESASYYPFVPRLWTYCWLSAKLVVQWYRQIVKKIF